MKIALVYITFNRLPYTQLSLPRLLEDPTEDFDLYIWDNGSTDGTPEYLKSISDPRIKDIAFRPTNEGQSPAVNHAWTTSDADLLGKVDNDCLVTPGWTRTFASAHAEVPELGGVSCWQFPDGDFNYERARHKIRNFGNHSLLSHPYISGSAFLTRREDYQRFGPITQTFPSYWIALASSGRVNGWYYPLIQQEHMDDPRSEHCLLPDIIESRDLPFALRHRGLQSRAEFEAWIRQDVWTILGQPSDPWYFTGWRAALRRARRRWNARLNHWLPWR